MAAEAEAVARGLLQPPRDCGLNDEESVLSERSVTATCTACLEEGAMVKNRGLERVRAPKTS